MTRTISSSTPTSQRRPPSQPSGTPTRKRRARAQRSNRSQRNHQPLARYADTDGRVREVIVRNGAVGSVLVLDREASTHSDVRLVAHLACDEPAENAALVCRRYLEDLDRRQGDRYRCRRLTAEDAHSAPFAEPASAPAPVAAPAQALAGTAQIPARNGMQYRLALLKRGMSIPELRWCRQQAGHSDGRSEPVSVREAIASLESYEPVCELTSWALAAHAGASRTSTTVLRAELERVRESPIVLNRLLREQVLVRIGRNGLTMSEIAHRCGRIKRDRRGNESGETSWLARRIGVLPEGGRSAPTPWIHSDVLALIARAGLGLSPHEVEL